MPEPTASVALSGRYAYIVASLSYGGWGGYYYQVNFDVFDLVESVQRASMPIGDSPCIAVDHGFAYLGGSEFRVVDVSDPDAPKIVGSRPAPEYVWDIAVVGSRAYLAGNAGLTILNISDPTSPTLEGAVAIPGPAWSVAANGPYAYITTGSAGVTVVDVSHPAEPSVVATFGLPFAWDIAIRGSHAYVTDGSGLRVLDLARPSEPRLIGGVDMPAYAQDLALSGARAYVADWGDATHPSSLQVVDISNPARPVIVNSLAARVGRNGYWEYSDQIKHVDAGDGRVAVGGSVAQLWLGDCAGWCDIIFSGYLEVRSASAYEPAPPGSGPDRNAVSFLDTPVHAPSTSVQGTFALRGNDPNPFNPETSIRFDVPRESRVRIRIYDAKGRLVRTLVDDVFRPGRHEVRWQGRSEHGEAVASGIYIVQLEAQGFRQTAKITLLK